MAARKALARAELVGREAGGVTDIVVRAARWATEWLAMGEGMDAVISLELEVALLNVVLDLVQALGLDVVQPLFAQAGGHSLVALAEHCHKREVREENTVPLETFVNSELCPVLGLQHFP